MNVQISGTKKCNDTKKAERFFKERGLKFQFIDMKEKGMSKGEFKATVRVYISTTFYRWVFGFNGKIKIVGPQNVTMIYKELLQKALDEA